MWLFTVKRFKIEKSSMIVVDFAVNNSMHWLKMNFYLLQTSWCSNRSMKFYERKGRQRDYNKFTFIVEMPRYLNERVCGTQHPIYVIQFQRIACKCWWWTWTTKWKCLRGISTDHVDACAYKMPSCYLLVFSSIRKERRFVSKQGHP